MVAREHYSPEEKASNALHCGAKRSHVFCGTYGIAISDKKVLLTNSLNLIRKSIRMKVRLMMSCYLNYNLRTVNHKEEYRSDLGVTNNQAESLFSRSNGCTTDKFTVSATNTYLTMLMKLRTVRTIAVPQIKRSLLMY